MSSIQEADPYFLYNSYKDIRGSFIDGPRDKELQVQILQLKAYNNQLLFEMDILRDQSQVFMSEEKNYIKRIETLEIEKKDMERKHVFEISKMQQQIKDIQRLMEQKEKESKKRFDQCQALLTTEINLKDFLIEAFKRKWQ